VDHRHRRLLLLSIVSFACFAGIVLLVATSIGVDRVDESIRAAADQHRHDPLRDAADLLTDVVSPTVDAVVLGLVAIWLAARRRSWVPLIAATTTAWLVALTVVSLKHLVGAAAPASENATGTSFPSGHTAMALTCFGVLTLLMTRPGTTARRTCLAATAALTLLVAAGLVYAGFHWLSDTVASTLLGVGALALLELWLSRRRASRSSPAGTPPTGRTAHRR
jgi:membrane-associated phospholipid phosphatase